MQSVTLSGNTYQPNRYQAVKFGLWISMASIIMMFVAFTSAFLVRKPAGNWLEFSLPYQFYVSTGLIIISSVCIEMAFRFFKSKQEKEYKLSLILSLVFGLSFLLSQYWGWMQMKAMGIFIQTNVSGSFIYLISGVHALHIIGGIACIIVAIIHGFGLPFTPTTYRIMRLDLVRQYWHFVDILWIYLLIFFITQ